MDIDRNVGTTGVDFASLVLEEMVGFEGVRMASLEGV